MMKKYRVNEVAKDLNVENKDVIEALKPFSDEPKKYMTALTEEDLDVVFDTFTKENSVESFTAGFTAVFSFSTTAFSCTLAVVFSFDSGASLEEEVG